MTDILIAKIVDELFTMAEVGFAREDVKTALAGVAPENIPDTLKKMREDAAAKAQAEIDKLP